MSIDWAAAGWLLAALGTGGAVPAALRYFVRRGLAPTRVPESVEPTDLPWQTVRFPTCRGKHLFGWYLPAAPGAPALAILHGWGGNVEVMLPLAAPLARAGYGVLLFDARSHGGSDEDDHVSLPRFAEDMESALDWLQGRPGAGPVGAIGHSVGAGAALLVASRRPDLAAVVSLAAFSHPAAMMRRWLAYRRIPYWPLGAWILRYIQHVIGHRFDDIAPRHTIRAVTCPVLLVHGMEDETVPVAEAREIFDQRAHDRVELLLIPGSHDEYGEVEQHMDALIRFLDRAFDGLAGRGFQLTEGKS